MSKYVLVESEKELLRIFRQSGGRLMVERDSISIASNGNLDHEAVMRKQDFLHCTDHFGSLTKKQRDDHGLMLAFIKIFISKWADVMRDIHEDEDESEPAFKDAVKAYLVSNHPMRFASKRLLCNEKFVTDAMRYMNITTSNLNLVFKHALPWWIKRKMWYVIRMHQLCGNMDGIMEKMGVFNDPKVAIHALSFNIDLMFSISKRNPSMLLDEWFWKEIFKKVLSPYHMKRFLKHHVPYAIKFNKQSFLSLVRSCNKENKIMDEGLILECGLYDWTSDDDFLSML